MAVMRALLLLLSYLSNLDIWSWLSGSLAWPTKNQDLDRVLVSARYVDADMGLDACVAKRVKSFLTSSSEDFIRVDDLCRDLRECSDDGTLVLRCKAGGAEFEVQDPDQIDLNDLRDRVRLWNEISDTNSE